MSSSSVLESGAAAARLVADLMPIAVAVTGPGEAAFAAALQQAGAGAEIFTPGDGAGFDLAVLLAPPERPEAARHGAAIAALAAASDRLLFVPVPLGRTEAGHADAWFELFAEHGFQPVVEYDASFLGAGAFLVDRNATAAEEELAAFADRVSGAAPPPVAPPPPEPAVVAAQQAEAEASRTLRATLAAREAELATIRAEADRWRSRAGKAETELTGLKREIGAWETVGRWVWAVCGQGGRDTAAALRLAGWTPPRRGRLARMLRKQSKAERALLADAALVRTSRHFDAAWYIASHPELAETGADPVWHYVLRGAAAGAEPGPYFDSKPWREKYPLHNPLAAAVRQGNE
jgi:hypothetical protein